MVYGLQMDIVIDHRNKQLTTKKINSLEDSMTEVEEDRF